MAVRSVRVVEADGEAVLAVDLSRNPGMSEGSVCCADVLEAVGGMLLLTGVLSGSVSSLSSSSSSASPAGDEDTGRNCRPGVMCLVIAAYGIAARSPEMSMAGMHQE